VFDPQKKGKDKYYGLEINEPFYAFSKSDNKKAIEVIGGETLSLKPFERFKETQQFYLDAATKTIKSVAYKDRSWDIQDSGASVNMQIWKTNGRWFQMFRYNGDKFINERGMFLGVQNNDNVIVTKNVQHRWNVRYVKNETTYKAGEYHRGYGFTCDRDFYIISKRDGRYLQTVTYNGEHLV
jgi:hypothetical protein